MKLRALTILTLTLALLLAGACGKKDADIQKEVQDRLAAQNVTGVTAAVNDGVVTLTGEVADITVRTRAEGAVRNVEGVKSVTNNITTRPLVQATPAAAEPALRGIVEENLKKAGCTGASVTVDGGTVTLSGTVPADKFATCVQIANQAGATRVVNQLQRGK